VIGDTAAHYDNKAVYMEAFSRPLWSLVPYFAGNKEKNSSDWAALIREGLANGTDRQSDEYWGDCKPFDQRFVEMAAISYGILYAREDIWDPLTEKEKDNLATYLGNINDYELPVCNWLMFAVLVNIALRSVDREYRPDMLERYLNDCETFYLGKGWYQDGDSGQKDYYVSFAIHFYNLIYADRCGDVDPERANKFKERALLFGKQFMYWFDSDGAAIPFGRSLTYRFSQVAFFSACVLTGLEPLPRAVMKGIIRRHLQWWMSKEIFDRAGVLTIGYGYPNLVMAERYNAPGSPYWAMKTFAILALDDDEEFWQLKEEEYPGTVGLHPMKEADMLIYHYGKHTCAFVPGVYSPNGHGQLPAKYSKFAYDSRFGVSVAKSQYEIHENAPDSMLAFVINGYVYVRRICIESRIGEDHVYSKWTPYPGIEVETRLYPKEEGHVRKHTIRSEIDCLCYECGFSISRDKEKYRTDISDNRAKAGNDFSSCSVITYVKSDNDSRCEGGEIINADPNTNLIFNKTVIPAVKIRVGNGETEIESKIEAAWTGRQ
jgi:hypothetical protein